MDLSPLRFFVKVSRVSEKRRPDDAEEPGMQNTRDVLHRGRGLGDVKLPSPGFSAVKQPVPGYYSLIARSRILGP